MTFECLDWGIRYDNFFDKISLNQQLCLSNEANEIFRCFWIHISIPLEIHPFQMQEAFRFQIRKVLNTNSKLNNEPIQDVLKLDSFVDASILVNFWPKEFHGYAIIIWKKDQKQWHIFDPYPDVLKKKEIVLRLCEGHYTLMRNRTDTSICDLLKQLYIEDDLPSGHSLQVVSEFAANTNGWSQDLNGCCPEFASFSVTKNLSDIAAAYAEAIADAKVAAEAKSAAGADDVVAEVKSAAEAKTDVDQNLIQHIRVKQQKQQKHQDETCIKKKTDQHPGKHSVNHKVKKLGLLNILMEERDEQHLERLKHKVARDCQFNDEQSDGKKYKTQHQNASDQVVDAKYNVCEEVRTKHGPCKMCLGDLKLYVAKCNHMCCSNCWQSIIETETYSRASRVKCPFCETTSSFLDQAFMDLFLCNVKSKTKLQNVPFDSEYCMSDAILPEVIAVKSLAATEAETAAETKAAVEIKAGIDTNVAAEGDSGAEVHDVAEAEAAVETKAAVEIKAGIDTNIAAEGDSGAEVNDVAKAEAAAENVQGKSADDEISALEPKNEDAPQVKTGNAAAHVKPADNMIDQIPKDVTKDPKLTELVTELYKLDIGTLENCKNLAIALAAEGLMNLNRLKTMHVGEAKQMLTAVGFKKLQLENVLQAMQVPIQITICSSGLKEADINTTNQMRAEDGHFVVDDMVACKSQKRQHPQEADINTTNQMHAEDGQFVDDDMVACKSQKRQHPQEADINTTNQMHAEDGQFVDDDMVACKSQKRQYPQEGTSRCEHQRDSFKGIKRAIVYSNTASQLFQPNTFEESLSQVPKYHSNDSQMNIWKTFVQSNCEFKTLEHLQSYNDTANCRIPIKSNPNSVKQCNERDARHASRSGPESLPVTNDMDTAACLGYAEMSLHSFHEVLSKIHEIIGPSNQASFLDIGHGTTAHLVISASESGRFVHCAGIEIGLNRFTASLRAVQIAESNGFVKKPIKLVHGDVLTSKDIQLSNFNVYNFFDKVCKEVSQQTIKKIILEHVRSNFALGPIVYATCMGTHYLKHAMTELKETMDPSDRDRLLVVEKESINVTTRFRV
jgi:hypothetical protein